MPVVRNGPLPSTARTQDLNATVDKDGTVKGTAAPGARIEIANLSTAPTGHLLPSDVVEVATADANGQFSFKMPSALAGDVLQIQTRASAVSAPSSTVQVRVDASDRANDPRAAFVSVKRLRVDLDAQGNAVIAARTNLPLCEPDAVLRFTNTRTNQSVDVVVDPMGRIPTVTLAAQKGDSIDVAVTDDIATRAPVSSGALTVGTPALSSPAAVNKDAQWAQLVTIPGRLFLDKLGLGKQGQIGDCPVPAGASAIAAVDPNAIRDLIRDRGDGTYLVTFHPPGDKAVEIVVDNKLFARGSSPMYGAGARDPQSGDVELWFPLVEKAYAAHVGSYDVLAQGTSVGKVMADFLGRANTEVWLKDAKPDDVWQKMLRAKENNQAMACGTYPSSESARYSGSGLYPNHAYSVISMGEVNGQRMVTMRNPWGGSGFSGEFQIKLDDFVRLYQVLNIC
jgi:hypothetical protein